MARYTIGIDYGTLSGRALLVNVDTGEEKATCVKEYAHGVMDERLPSGKKLGADWALQDPEDYIEVLREVVPKVIREGGVSPDEVIGIGVDFTTCTVLPVLRDGTPLCKIDKFKDEPNAYVKLWKHHAAQYEADRINKVIAEIGESFSARYGGKISSEWLLPKAMQILDECPEVYETMDYIVEAGDWVVWQLTGRLMRNSCMAGYKNVWSKRDGYPKEDFYAALDPRLKSFIRDKIATPIYPVATRAGGITREYALITGLKEGVSVATAHSDAHVALLACSITSEAKMLMIMGTSTCHIFLGTEEKTAPGMCGVVEDGVIPGYFGYEAGQSCVGDHFAWLADNLVPESYAAAARKENKNIHQYLTEKASKLNIGESGIVALDWWNGNRSVLVDSNLTGLFVGMTLTTKVEELYRALIEATAFGTKKIIDTFEKSGLAIKELYAAGGIAAKNPFLMQIYADVCNREIKISGSNQAGALGSAIIGAAAAGVELNTAINNMSSLKDVIYKPIPENVEKYAKLYEIYDELHEYFGRKNDVMKRLKVLKGKKI